MELPSYLQGIVAGIAAISSIIAALDQFLAASKKFVANSTWQLLTGKKGVSPMSAINNIEDVVAKLEELGSRGMKALETIDQVVAKASSTVANVATISGDKQLAEAATKVETAANAAAPVIEKLAEEAPAA